MTDDLTGVLVDDLVATEKENERLRAVIARFLLVCDKGGHDGRYRVDEWQEFEESRELEKLAAE